MTPAGGGAAGRAACFERARALVGDLACEMAEVWRVCREEGLLEHFPKLCLAAYAAVIKAAGAVVRANYEVFIEAGLWRARREVLPYSGVVDYETFIKTAAARYLLYRNALAKTLGVDPRVLPEALRRIRASLHATVKNMS